MDGSLTHHKKSAAARQGATRGRIAPNLRAAMKLRIEQGLTIKDACERAGYSEAGWHLAMKRSHVVEAYEQMEAAFIQQIDRRRAGYRARAIEVAADLMERATSEAVRMKAVEFFAGEARQPTVAVQINNAAAAGYTYARPDAPSVTGSTQVIDGKAKDVTPE